ncbi:MAG TPA: FtsX-like permease family protein [Candidatus Saccharimonadales bacterium]|jgi:putative ABC transport system permease protein|nr:FtsX-like permease family protein [Candidatus Saccharimonadales bacterium]
MKFRGLIFANLFRKKLRLALTIGSFAVALFLFGLLAVVKGAFSQGVEIAGVDRLVVINRVSLIQPLPFSYRDKILRLPGVKLVTFDSWFGGIYQDPKNFFPQFAIDDENQRQVFPELEVPEVQWKAFLNDRQGAIVGASTAKRFQWKVGDRVPIRGTIYAGTWEFNIDGIYQGKRQADDETQFWFHSKYLEERAPVEAKGLIGWYTVKLSSPDDALRISRAIDEQFANSTYETHTDTEKSFALGFVKQMGNIGFLMTAIGTVVFFTLLLVTGNTMAIAVRERTAELAILKAVGFSDRFVLLMVMAESLTIAVVGAALGLGLAKVFTLMGDPTHGMLPLFILPPQSVGIGLGIALAVGAISGLLPAVGAMRLRIVNALRRV